MAERPAVECPARKTSPVKINVNNNNNLFILFSRVQRPLGAVDPPPGEIRRGDLTDPGGRRKNLILSRIDYFANLIDTSSSGRITTTVLFRTGKKEKPGSSEKRAGLDVTTALPSLSCEVLASERGRAFWLTFRKKSGRITVARPSRNLTGFPLVPAETKLYFSILSHPRRKSKLILRNIFCGIDNGTDANTLVN